MFSLVIPLYNKQKYIERAVLSALSQNTSFDQIIIVNDGSTDDSLSVIKKYEINNLVTIINQSNQGVSVARNTGVDASVNEYICFLDADDELLPNYLTLMKFLVNQYSSTASIFSVAHTKIYSQFEKSYVNMKKNTSLFKNPIIKYTLDYSIINSSSVCVKKEIFEKIKFPANERIGEDIYFWLRLFSISPLAHSNEVASIIHRDAENRSDTSIPQVPYHFKYYLNIKKTRNISIFMFLLKNSLYQIYGAAANSNIEFAKQLLDFFKLYQKFLYFINYPSLIISYKVILKIRSMKRRISNKCI